MKPIRLDQDVLSLTEFRAGMSSRVRQIAETRRPMLLTQNGRGVAVVLDVREFEAMQEQIGVSKDVIGGLLDVAAGRAVPHEEVMAKLLEELHDTTKAEE